MKDIIYDLTLRPTPFSVTHFKEMGKCLEILDNSDYRVLWPSRINRGRLLYNAKSGDDFKVGVINDVRLNDLGLILNEVPIESKKSKYPGCSRHDIFCLGLNEDCFHAHMMEATEKSKALYPNAPKRFLVIEDENGYKETKKLVCIICISE